MWPVRLFLLLALICFALAAFGIEKIPTRFGAGARTVPLGLLYWMAAEIGATF